MLENPTHSDFFIDIVNVDFMYVDEGAHQPPGEAKSYKEINSNVASS
ncbi:hypothetical protein P4629_00270 [Priestia aryabhattai]|nr:hypothetical protein [Priestia aryabhattai]MED3957141.1 hypothetical protein [Priestia aryabhattai]MED4003824.1 hypothetical protein [Priestia aryabhattai]